MRRLFLSVIHGSARALLALSEPALVLMMLVIALIDAMLPRCAIAARTTNGCAPTACRSKPGFTRARRAGAKWSGAR